MTPTNTLFARLMRRAPILLIAAAAVLAFIFFRHLVSLQGLEQHSHDLLALRDQHYLATALGSVDGGCHDTAEAVGIQGSS